MIATTASPVDGPVCAIAAAAAAARIRFFGLTAPRTTPRPTAFRGVKLSMAPIHFGGGDDSPGAGRPRHWRSARNMRTTPSTTLVVDVVSEALLSVATSALSAMRYTTAVTTESPTIQPMRNDGPLAHALGERSMRITATIAIGLRMTPTANGRISLIAGPKVTLPHRSHRCRPRLGSRRYRSSCPARWRSAPRRGTGGSTTCGRGTNRRAARAARPRSGPRGFVRGRCRV